MTVSGTIQRRRRVVVLCHVECIFIAAVPLRVTGKVDETGIACPQSLRASKTFSSDFDRATQMWWQDLLVIHFTVTRLKQTQLLRRH